MLYNEHKNKKLKLAKLVETFRIASLTKDGIKWGKDVTYWLMQYQDGKLSYDEVLYKIL